MDLPLSDFDRTPDEWAVPHPECFLPNVGEVDAEMPQAPIGP